MNTVEHDGLIISSTDSVESMHNALGIDAAAEQDDHAGEQAPPADGQQANAQKEAELRQQAAQTEADLKQASKKRESPQQRIDKAVAAQRQAERERDQLRQQIESFQRQPPPPPRPVQQQPQPQQPIGDPEPQFEDFQKDPAKYNNDPYTAWLLEHQKWAARDAYRQGQQVAQQTQQHQQRVSVAMKRDQTAKAAFAKLAETDPEFKSIDQSVAAYLAWEDPGDPAAGRPYSPGTPLGNLIADTENPLDFVKHFSEHRDELQRISALHPLLQAVALGELKQQLAAASTAQRPLRNLSAAKPPIKPVGSSPVISSDDAEDEANLPIEKFIKVGNERDQKSRGSVSSFGRR